MTWKWVLILQFSVFWGALPVWGEDFSWDEKKTPWPKERHPVLLCESGDRSTLRARIRRRPYQNWWNSLTKRLQSLSKRRPWKFSGEVVKTNYAKEAALAYFLTSKANYGHLAVDLVSKVRTRSQGGKWHHYYLLHENTGLVNLCVTYDLLHPYLQKRPQAKKYLRNLIVAMAKRHRTYRALWYYWHYNNHQIRHYAALGMAAVTLADHRRAKEWFRYAMKWLKKIFAYQETEDGGFAEGHNYLEYSAVIYLPFFSAVENFLGLSPAQTPVMERIHAWSLAIRMPGGYRPNFDDGGLSTYPSSLLTTLLPPLQAKVYAWDYRNGPDANRPQISAVESICLYDDQVRPEAPRLPLSIFLPKAGNAVFRSGWTRDSTYVFALAEEGKARINGGGHEHPDGGSFILASHGEYLLLDSGYIKWEKRQIVYGAANHNVVLVNGKGSPNSEIRGALKRVGVDARWTGWEVKNEVVMARMTTERQGAEWDRVFLFIEKKFLVVIDFLESDRKRKYTLLLHGHGGGTSGGRFQKMSQGALWSRPRAKLWAQVVGPGKIAFSHKDQPHSLKYGQVKTHTVLEVGQRAASTRFITWLIPTSNTVKQVPKVVVRKTKKFFQASVSWQGNQYQVWCHRTEKTVHCRKYDGQLTLKYYYKF